MKQNFFEMLGAANIERIHSQVLSWMFVSDALTSGQKSAILKTLAGASGSYSTFRCLTEYRSIDILIRANDDIFVIENKIKTSEHDNQLKRYEDILRSDADPIFLNIRDKHFIYLTLVPEETEFGGQWANVSYKNLSVVLADLKFEKPINFEQHIFNEYAETVGRLVNIFSAFEKDHAKFENVFLEGSLKKSDKLPNIDVYTDEQKYVAQNQLETIFQKHFLSKVAKAMNTGFIPLIAETHGVATMHFDIKKDMQFGERKYNIGIQFQGESVKVNFADADYNNSKADDLPQVALDVFGEVAKKMGMRLNNPRSRAYISISKSLGDDVWRNNFETVVEVYKAKFGECISIIEGAIMPAII